MHNKSEQKNFIGRPKTFEKSEIIKLAMHHFWEFGYDNSTLDDLLLAMGIKKSSFYRTFKSKEELFSKCLNFYREDMLILLENLKKEVGPKEAMLLLTTMIVSEFKETGKVKGCLLINSAQECCNKYSDLSNQINIEFIFMQNLFISFIQEAKGLDEITNKKEAKIIAGRYMNTLNGLIITMQVGVANELIDDIVESLKEMLE